MIHSELTDSENDTLLKVSVDVINWRSKKEDIINTLLSSEEIAQMWTNIVKNLRDEGFLKTKIDNNELIQLLTVYVAGISIEHEERFKKIRPFTSEMVKKMEEYYNYKKPHNSPEMPTILSPSDHIETGDKKENKKIHKEEFTKKEPTKEESIIDTLLILAVLAVIIYFIFST